MHGIISLPDATSYVKLNLPTAVVIGTLKLVFERRKQTNVIIILSRAISVMLGDTWKSLSAEKKQIYENRAKVLADQQKKINPDCWKRKK